MTESPTSDRLIRISGDYTFYRDFEVMSSDPTSRITQTAGSWPPEIQRGSIEVYGDHNKFINLVVHDLNKGFGFWGSGTGGEIYGSLIYNNGWVGPDRVHGHGIYAQNQFDTKRIADNLVFNQFNAGLHAYGSSAAFLQGLTVEGNAMFDNSGWDILIGGGMVSKDIVVDGNYTYQSRAPHLTAVDLSLYSDSLNVTATDNYFANTEIRMLRGWDDITFTGNTITNGPERVVEFRRVPAGVSTSSYNWDNNHYYSSKNLSFVYLSSSRDFDTWKSLTGLDSNSTLETGTPPNAIFVEPNEYESGRGSVVVYNWQLLNQVVVDLSSVLSVGDTYEVHHAYDIFGSPVASGQYDGQLVAIPMTTVVAPTPISYDSAPPIAAGPEFGAFLVRTVGEGGPTSGTIAGEVFNDTNANAAQEAGEAVLTGIDVYVDSNDNGQLDPGEPSAITGTAGQFSFPGLAPGSYVVRHADQFGLQTTTSVDGGHTVQVSEGTLQSVTLGVRTLFALTATDELTIYGTPADDTVSIDSFDSSNVVFHMNGSLHTAPGNFQSLIVSTDAGNDTVAVTGSTGDDTVRLYGGSGRIEFPGRTVDLESAESISVLDSGGYDRAYFYDTVADEVYLADPETASLVGGGFSNSVEGFDRSYAFANEGGSDLAIMYDSPNADFFASDAFYGRLSGKGFFNYAWSFDRVEVHATAGGHDRAFIHDSAGDDSYTATPTSARMTGLLFDVEALSFDRVYAYATAGGYDTAALHDSTENDYFRGGETFARMSGALYYNQVEAFDEVTAVASVGLDRAYFFDTSGIDTFTFLQSSANMATNDAEYQVTSFDRVYAYASSEDVAVFDELANSSQFLGDGDRAATFDTDRIQNAYGIGHVSANAISGNTPALHLSAVDYIFEQNW